MKKILLLLILTNITVFSQFSGGNGSAASPYEIRTKDELMQIENHPGTPENLKYFVLKRNIRDSVRVPIKKIENAVFDGQGYKITLAINDSTDDVSALFRIAVGDVGILNLVVDGYVKGNWASGILGNAWGKGAKNIKLTNNINLIKAIARTCASGFVHSGMDCELSIDRSINLGTCEVLIYEQAPAGGFVSHFYFNSELSKLTISNGINANFIKGKSEKNNAYTTGFVGYEGAYGEIYSIPQTNILKSINTGVIKPSKFWGPFVLIMQ